MPPDDEPEPTGSTKLFQIREDDLCALESMLPDLLWFKPELLTPRQKIKWRKIMEILTNVRWNDGPPAQCFRIPAGDDPQEG